MAMEHTSGALRSRNSASLAPEHVSGRQSASMVGREVVLLVLCLEKTTERLRLSWVVPEPATVFRARECRSHVC